MTLKVKKNFLQILMTSIYYEIKDIYISMDHKNDTSREMYFIRKAEKLTSALYRVTDSIADDEPLKWRLRDEGLALLLLLLSFTDKGRGGSLKTCQDAIHSIVRLSSLLEVSYMGSLVSKMNFSILKDEYNFLRSGLVTYQNEQQGKSDLTVSQEEIAMLGNMTQSHELSLQSSLSEGDKKMAAPFMENGNFLNKGSAADIRRSLEKSFSQSKEKPKSGTTQRKNNSSPKRERGGNEERERRRETILTFIKDNNDVSIKDILKIPYLSKNFSEKTVQRELIDLVSKGELKKEGERRWSRYSINK